jgi:hypothetical protein
MNLQVPVLPTLALLLVAAAAGQPPDTDLSRAQEAYVGAGHWVGVRLVGKKSNRDGIGAKIEVVAGGVRQQRERIAGSGYLSQDDGRVHFGLGKVSTIEKLTVTWPSGAVQTLDHVAADRVISIEEK